MQGQPKCPTRCRRSTTDPNVVVSVLSDADFPYWLGWQKTQDGLFQESGQCDIHDMLEVLKASGARDRSEEARQHLRDYFNDRSHRHVRDWAQRLVCRFGSEWDTRNNSRCDKLKEQNGLGVGRDGLYYGNDAEFDAHMTFVRSLQRWADERC